MCVTKGIASTTECVICKTIPQHKIDAGVYRSRMKSNEWQGMRRAKDEVRGQRKQLNKSVSVKMERETKTALNVEINENSQAQTPTQSHAYAYMHTNRSLTHKMYKRDDKENRKHSKIFDTIIHSFGTNYGHKISAYVHKRPKSVELPLNFFLVFVFVRQTACTHILHAYTRLYITSFSHFANFIVMRFGQCSISVFVGPFFICLVWFSLVHFTTIYTMPFDATHPHVN